MSLSYNNELEDCLAYTRNFTGAIAIFQLLDLNIIDEISQKRMKSTDLAQQLNLQPNMLEELLQYSINEGILIKDSSGYFSLSGFGQKIEKCRGWFEMLVGGYSETFMQMGSCLRKEKKYASRNGKYVGKGSCNISLYGALPLTKELMNLDESEEYLILDLGCGNGLYLQMFCEQIPNIRAIGVEPSVEGYLQAEKELANSELKNKIKLYNSSTIDFFKEYDGDAPDFIVFAFVLHEILEQSGYDELLKLLKDLRARFPASQLIVIEVEQQFFNTERMKTSIERDYYNPYFLIHTFTEQELKGLAFWRNLYDEAGYTIEKEQSINDIVDPSGLEVGFLLTPKE